MECFTHPGACSVGVCKTCGRAVCRDCAVDAGFAIACSPACAREAADVHEMNQRGKRIYGIGVARRRFPAGAAAWLLFGTLFSAFGAYVWLRTGKPEWFLLLFGLASFLIAGFAYRRARDVGIDC